MDPLGHLAPWLFKDTMEAENGKLRYIDNKGTTTDGEKLILDLQSVWISLKPAVGTSTDP